MYCRKCGKQIGDNTKFCRYCGNEVKSETVKNENNVTKKKPVAKKSPVKLLILCIVFLITVLLIAGGFWLVKSGAFDDIIGNIHNTAETEQDIEEREEKEDEEEREEKEDEEEREEKGKDDETEDKNKEDEDNVSETKEEDIQKEENEQSWENRTDDGWRQAYTDYLYKLMTDYSSILYTNDKNGYSSGIGFGIAYIDNDYVPELIVRYTDQIQVGGAALCGYFNGEVMTLQKSIGQNGYFNYAEKKGVIGVPYTGSQEETSITYYRLNGLSFKEECSMKKKNPYSDKPTFYINEKEVKKDKYQEKESEYVQGYQPWSGIELNDITAVNVRRILGGEVSAFLALEQQSYILPNSSSAYLNDVDVRYLSAEQLRIARNEIYARHGYIFRSEDLQIYFAGKSWYRPSIMADDFSDNMLNDFERENLKLIKKYEEEF